MALQQSNYTRSAVPEYTSTKSPIDAQPMTETFTPPRTPTATSTSAYALFTEIQEIHTALSLLPSLAPGEKINALLTKLVQLCIAPHSTSFISSFFDIPGISSLCERLRPICAAAEGELERYWAGRMCLEAIALPAPNAEALLGLFPYYQNYIDLSAIECSVLSAFLPTSTPPSPRKFAFIGSGPLPLTSLCMLDRFPNSTIHNIDRDEGALKLSQELCEKLGYSGMSFGCEDVTHPSSATDWKAFDVIFLAALVGMDTGSKLSILSSLAARMRPGALIVARSARGLRSVLYPVRKRIQTRYQKLAWEMRSGGQL